MFGDVGQARTKAAMLLVMIDTTSSRTCTKPTVGCCVSFRYCAENSYSISKFIFCKPPIPDTSFLCTVNLVSVRLTREYVKFPYQPFVIFIFELLFDRFQVPAEELCALAMIQIGSSLISKVPLGFSVQICLNLQPLGAYQFVDNPSSGVPFRGVKTFIAVIFQLFESNCGVWSIVSFLQLHKKRITTIMNNFFMC